MPGFSFGLSDESDDPTFVGRDGRWEGYTSDEERAKETVV